MTFHFDLINILCLFAILLVISSAILDIIRAFNTEADTVETEEEEEERSDEFTITIESDGSLQGTSVYDDRTGEQIPYVESVSFTCSAGDHSPLTARLIVHVPVSSATIKPEVLDQDGSQITLDYVLPAD